MPNINSLPTLNSGTTATYLLVTEHEIAKRLPFDKLVRQLQLVSGPVGPAGPRGGAGVTGPQGVQGPQGVGPSGPSGATGPSGIGYGGPSGPTGTSGPSGASGPSTTGPTGPTGASGPSGPQGVGILDASINPAGVVQFVLTDRSTIPLNRSIIGPSGPPSTISGPSGPSGATGPSITGPSGPSGASGPSGVSNVPGPTGPTGASGPQGAGYMGVPQTIVSSNYTILPSDQSKQLFVTSAATITIPPNSLSPLPIGTVIVIVTANNIATITTADTLLLATTGSTGNRTVAAYGIASLMKVAATTWYISGAGVS